MMVISTLQKVDIAPYAVRKAWFTPQDYEIWWEDPRALSQVQIQFAASAVPDPAGLSLEYWRNSWPEVRVPKGAIVGAGDSGWLPNDGWSNGRWQKADCEIKQENNVLICTFQPLNRNEFPQMLDFPAVFRRPLKLRLHFQFAGVQIDQVHVFTDSVWREIDIAIEWKSPDAESAKFDGSLQAFNGEILQVRPLNSFANKV